MSKSLIERLRDHLSCYWKEGDVAPQLTSIELMLIEEAANELAAAQKDAERYRYLKSVMTVPHNMQSWLKFNNFNPDTFNMGIDESIDAAMRDEK